MVQLPKLLWNHLAHSKEVRLQERGNRRLKLSRVVASSLFFLSMLFVGLQGAQATPGHAPLLAPEPGLQGEYFDNPDLQPPMVFSRMDNIVDFFWANDAPDASLPHDGFSVRWSGQVQAQFSEMYTFHTFSDDGVRLWVDGQLLIDNWTVHGTEEDSGSLPLQAGEWYDIRLEYFEGGGEARMSLEWSSPSTTQSVIPTFALRYPDVSKVTISHAPATAIADGSSPIVIDVEMLDELGNPIQALPIFVQLSGEFNKVNNVDVHSGEWFYLGLTDAFGTITGTITSTRAEEKFLLVKAGDVVLLSAIECTFSAGEAIQLQILFPGELASPGDEPGKIGVPDVIAVGQSTTLDLRAVDAYWNTDSSFNEVVDLSTSDPEAVLPATTSLVGGASQFTVTWNSEGSKALYASTSSPPLSGERTIEVLGNRITGLLGRYFNNPDLELPVTATRYDSQIDFVWTGSPIEGVYVDNFSVQWLGQVDPVHSETYTFYTISDDGVRLWIDDQLLIENWTDHGSTEDSGQITLEAGRPVDLRMEFYDRGYDAVARLEWSSASTPREVIPTARLQYLELSGTSLSFDPPEAPADGLTTTTLTVRLANAVSVPFVDIPVAIKIDGGHTAVNGATIVPGEWRTIGISDVNGEVTAHITSTEAETKFVSVRAEGQILGVTSSAEFIPAEPSRLLLLFPGETHMPGEAPGKSGLPQTIEVGRAVEVTLLAADDFWNLTSSFDGTAVIETPPDSASHPELVFFENGSTSFSITWNEDGLHALTASNPEPGYESMSITEEVEVQERNVLTIGDGETLYVDETRYEMFVNADAGDVGIFYDGSPGFEIGDDILILNVLGEGMGVYELRRIELIFPEMIFLDAPLESSYGGPFTKTIVQKVPHYGDVLVQNGGTISAHPWDGETGGIVFFRAENLTVEEGGAIDATALGFRAGEGPGSGGYVAGGGYGSYGGDDPGGAQGGLGYGLATEPMYLGSAGGDASATENIDQASGGRGGGIVRLGITETLQIDGSIESNGGSRWVEITQDIGGGGSGGSIWITASSYQGSGQVNAYGGNSYQIVSFEDPLIDHGGGSGGRIALHSAVDGFTGSYRIIAGDRDGGPGTQYFKNTTSGETTLRVDNRNLSTKPALLTAAQVTTWYFDTIELIQNGDLEITTACSF
jgi:hypothetical protein